MTTPPLTSDEGSTARYRRALDSLWLVFQPIVSAAQSGAPTIGYEALCRTSEKGLTNPQELLRLGVTLGQMDSLARVVRERAMEVLRRRQDISVFINIDVGELLGPLGEGPQPLDEFATRIVFEVTERTPITQLTETRARASALRARGYRFALDDLGGGYAGLSSLALIEPAFVKIDRSLVRGVDTEPLRKEIIHSMLGLCRSLKVPCIAGGVESASERDALLSLDCALMQGFFFGRPVVV